MSPQGETFWTYRTARDRGRHRTATIGTVATVSELAREGQLFNIAEVWGDARAVGDRLGESDPGDIEDYPPLESR